jgi:DNA modification methylase
MASTQEGRVIPYVQDADFVLYNADAREALVELPSSSANCIVTSPPYYLLRDYGSDGQIGAEKTLAEYVENLVAVFRDARRVLRDDGVFWLNVGDTYSTAGRGNRHAASSTLTSPERQELVSPVIDKRRRAPLVKPKDLYGAPFELALALREDGWWLRQTVIWDKTQTLPEAAKDRPTTSHEYVFLLSKSARYWYDADAIAEPATWERWGAQTARKAVVGKATLAKRNEKVDVPTRATRNARSVWRGNSAQFSGDHSAVMPDWLAERCILAGCPVGGTVLDPFAGAGTTALAARRYARSSIGIELSEKSCAVAAKRLAQLPLLIPGRVDIYEAIGEGEAA